ncbi:hypothetical protein [Victivallis vadensis]|uniref:hypothetical protein n=1 Tax=Victivallis vadensis TaxID=172901 RepID=UPI000310613E|nr:hypothetical protein [Victivallis vadensis]
MCELKAELKFRTPKSAAAVRDSCFYSGRVQYLALGNRASALVAGRRNSDFA